MDEGTCVWLREWPHGDRPSFFRRTVQLACRNGGWVVMRFLLVGMRCSARFSLKPTVLLWEVGYRKSETSRALKVPVRRAGSLLVAARVELGAVDLVAEAVAVFHRIAREVAVVHHGPSFLLGANSNLSERPVKVTNC